MIIKVAGKFFDSANVPIMIIFSDEEKIQLKNMKDNKFVVPTPRMNEEEIQKFIVGE